MLLQGKVGLVTGAGSGIGRAAALALAREGAGLVLGNRNAQQGEAVAQAINKAGGRAVFQPTDVTRPEQVEALVRRAVQEFGRLDLAFNNAGAAGSPLPLHDHEPASAAAIINVNVLGVFYCLKYEIAQMLQNGGGSIVNNSSVLGLKGLAGLSVYVASKHAVTGMTRAAALDYARQGIRVNAVGPGPIDTPLLASSTDGDPQSHARFVPMGRLGRPEEIAAAVVWLCSDSSSYVTGHTLPIDGGLCAR